jgi:DNA-binding HxlR family transcriptional regulator
MPNRRAYRLLCPIARALDRVGDRWTLLILRDLHAGPARFTELQNGLPGLASNLLSSRLRQLQDDGLVHHLSGEHGAHHYELTDEGEATAPLLYALGNYGSRFAPAENIRRPGNLRTIVVNMRESLRHVVEPDDQTHVELVIDGESFGVRIADGGVTVRYGSEPEASASIEMAYEPLIDVVDGRMTPAQFMSTHVQVTRGQPAAMAFFAVMGRALTADD